MVTPVSQPGTAANATLTVARARAPPPDAATVTNKQMTPNPNTIIYIYAQFDTRGSILLEVLSCIIQLTTMLTCHVLLSTYLYTT